MSDIAWTLAGLAVIAGTWLWGTAADRRAVRRDAAAIRRVMSPEQRWPGGGW